MPRSNDGYFRRNRKTLLQLEPHLHYFLCAISLKLLFEQAVLGLKRNDSKLNCATLRLPYMYVKD